MLIRTCNGLEVREAGSQLYRESHRRASGFTSESLKDHGLCFAASSAVSELTARSVRVTARLCQARSGHCQVTLGFGTVLI